MAARIKFEDFTMSEMETLENLTGVSMSKLAEAPSQARFMTALGFIVKQREDASFTWEDAQKLTMRQINELIDLSADDAEPQE